mgnify:CR=1 FL=1
MKKKARVKFIAIVWKEGKHYVSQCLNLDIASFGKTKKQALEKLEEAVGLYLESNATKLPKITSPSVEVRELQYA